MARRPLTEARNPRSRHLDLKSARDIVRCMAREDAAAPRALAAAAHDVARAAELAAAAIRSGGRIWLVGAGTSGRLAVLEAAECPPTFSTPPGLVRAVIAGGRRALTGAVEGAEDDSRAGAAAMRGVTDRDLVIGIAASGRTPFVLGALAAARRKRARSAMISCANIRRGVAGVRIVLRTGPEVVAGSTRLKAATATKLALNAITVAAMTRLGKVHDNLMVDVKPTNAKLRDRAIRIVSELAGVGAGPARAALESGGWNPKAAVVALVRGLGPRDARRHLDRHGGRLRAAIVRE